MTATDMKNRGAKGMNRLPTVALAAALLAPAAQAQDYPTRPIQLVVPFAPGAGSDTVARLVGQKMADGFGQPVVVENKSGAGGLLANRFVAGATPDGYTLLLVTGAHPAQAAMLNHLPFDPVKDISMISSLIDYPFVLIVRPDAPFRTVQDLIAYAKSNPKKLNYATTGPGSVHHLASELFNMMADVETVPIAYRGGATQLLELLAGRVDFVFETLPSAASAIADGRVRALAVTTRQRWPTLPDVPPVAEALPGYEVLSFLGLAVPGGTTAPVVSKLNAEVRRILDLPDIRDRFKALGGEPRPSSPGETQSFVASEIRKWQDVVSARGIERQ
jgi:tripartite-type tricarboxylate transporter receptor subunit TctC